MNDDNKIYAVIKCPDCLDNIRQIEVVAVDPDFPSFGNKEVYYCNKCILRVELTRANQCG
jgi:hypothetical protein